jgi:RNA polymerase sigma-70 factor (ECF subfamily)
MVATADNREDDELDRLALERARRGDEEACRQLVQRYQRRVFALLSRMLGSRAARAAVEDLAQETFLRVFRALPGYDPAGPARLSTWILTIATRLALDELARRRPATEPLERLAALPGGARTDEGAERRRLGRAIEGAVAALPHDFRAVFLLREYHGLEYAEIGRALDVDLGTVKSRLARARSALREALAEVHDAQR